MLKNLYMKFTLSLILDLIFFAFLSFFISLMWLRFFLSNSFIIVFLAVLISIFISFLLLFIKYTRQKNRKLNKFNKNQLFLLKTYFINSNKKQNFILLKKIFYLKRNTLELNKSYNTFYFDSKNYEFIGFNNVKFCFYFDSLYMDDLILKKIITSNKSAKTIYVLCNNFSASCKELIKFFNIDVRLITIDDFFIKLCQNLNLFEDKKEKKLPLKERCKTIIINFVNPKQTKSFFICGLYILMGSFLVRYNIYYIIVSTVLLTLALVCKLRQKKDIY